MTNRILEYLRANAGDHFHPMQLARALRAPVAAILPSLMTLRRQRAIRSWGCCNAIRYWSI